MVPAKRGTIISITSVHERIPWAGYSAYTASKAGLAMLMRTLALEAPPRRRSLRRPGGPHTINRDVWLNPETRADLLEKIPTGHLGTADDIAEVVVFLAGHGARYMTGSTVYVDGGMTLYPSFAHGG
jgi:NAD(P)-dependent dehydrogenase (short-subunit alcohol dehydrogenase family)